MQVLQGLQVQQLVNLVPLLEWNSLDLNIFDLTLNLTSKSPFQLLIYLFFFKKKENSRLNQIYKISIVIKPFNFASLWLTFVCVKGFWGQVVFVNSICTLSGKKWRIWYRKKKKKKKKKVNFTSLNKLPINQDSSSSINKPIINL